MLCRLLALAALLVLLVTRGHGAADPATLPAVGYHSGGVSYWDTPYFANGMHSAGVWMEYTPGGPWGSEILHWNEPNFSARGLPISLPEGRRYRALMFATNVPGAVAATGQPDRAELVRGRVVLEWRGNADLRLNGGGFLAGDSSGAATGSLVDGRRAYQFAPGGQLTWVEVHALDPANPLTDLDVWLPDPANPTGASLEGQLFHPAFLARLREAPWGFLRTMNLTETNANPEQDWGDRRLPSAVFQTGPQHRRSPGGGHAGIRQTGIAWEHVIALANAAELDLWITIPHLANETYIRNLALLMLHGGDGVAPYESPQENPVHPPLEPGRRIYLEYSNEIWSNGNAFAQGDWAQQRATELGIGKPQFNARRFCDVWRQFQEVFGGDQRIVRVAAIFTGVESYSTEFLAEMRTYGATLNPPVEPDAVAVTTYFGNGIQDWVFQRAQEQAGTDDPWFLTTQTFNPGGGNMRPVSVPADDPYWGSASNNRHIAEAYDEWMERMLSGDAREGAGPDATAFAGGFDRWAVDLARTAFPAPKPLIAYEGGPSLYTDGYDGGDARDDGITTFLSMMNRDPRIRDVYRAHLNMARSKGLRTHVMFTDSSPFGKYGQWGHLEHLTQPNADAHKYQFLLDWIAESPRTNHVDEPEGAVPSFQTPPLLPVAKYGEPYTATIATTGGDGPLSVEIIAERLRGDLSAEIVTAQPPRITIAGTATQPGLSFVYTRVVDANGDATWRTFGLHTVGGPNVIVEASFLGSNPGQSLPWTSHHVLASGLEWSGIDAGPGIVRTAGDDALRWSVNLPAEEAAATLAYAIQQGQHLTFTITPPEQQPLTLAGHDLTLTIRRQSWHAPRRYAVFSSIDGFAEPAALLTTPRSQSEDDQTLRIAFPQEPRFRALTQPVEFRLIGYSGQYGAHPTSLLALRVTGALGGEDAGEEWRVR